MNKDIFSIENFNIIQDEDNYYFFRALNNEDRQDIEEGITIDVNGEIIRIRTDRERFTGDPKYFEDSSISLNEVFDHIKEHHDKSTNCISLSSNSNVTAIYGRAFYNDTYAMIKVPKKDLGEKVFHAGPYMIEEIQKEIDKYLSNLLDLTPEKYYMLAIDYANTEEDLKRIIDMYNDYKRNGFVHDIFKEGIEYGEVNQTQTVEYNALNEKQNFEKSKLIAKLDIMNKNLLPNVSNKFLIQTIGNAFSSLELVHYKDIEKGQIYSISKEVIDMFSIVQQLPKEISEDIKRDLLKKVLSGDLELSEFTNAEAELSESDYSIEEIYTLTNGNIDYHEAINIKNKAFYLAKSRLRTMNIIDNLKRNLPQYEEIIEKEKNNLYGVEPEAFSRLSKYKFNVSESVSLELNKSEREILDFVNELSYDDLQNIIDNPLETLSELLEDHPEFKNKQLDKETYYATTILDMFDWSRLQIKSISSEQRKEIIDKLIENNCVSIYEDLKNHNIDEKYIPNILLTKVIKDLDYDNIDLNVGFSVDELEDFLGYYEVKETKIRLRSYQAAAVKNIEKAFEEKQFVSAILPTGAGKSYVALTEMEQFKDKRILYLAPNDYILNQLARHIIEDIHGTKYTTGKAAREIIKETFPNLEMCTYAYLTDNHPEIRDQKYDLIVWDELHRTGAEEWGKNLQKMLSHQDENTRILSVTATPQRDMDNRNMADEWAEQFGYTKEEIARHDHLAINMDLEEGIRQGFVMHPKIVNCEYNLQNGELDNLLEVLNSYPDSDEKTRILKKFDDLRDKVLKAKNVDEVLKDSIKKGGKYIVFLPVKGKNGDKIEFEDGIQVDSRVTGEDLVKEYQKTLTENLAGYIDSDEIEFHSMLSAYSKAKNTIELRNFEDKNSDKTQFMFVINMLNEGKHVEGVDGMIWYRPLDENSRILYLQQLGRIIYGIDPTKELPDDERTVCIDLVNNTYRVNINRKNKQTMSDIDKLYTVVSWMNLHGGKTPDINSTNRQEARYAATLRRIQEKYLQYIDDYSLIEEQPNKEEIEAVLFLGTSIDLWSLYIPERTKEDKEGLLDEDFEVFSVTGVLRDLYELKEKIDGLSLTTEMKLHEYRIVVEKLGRLVKRGEKTIEIQGEPKKDAIFDCDKTQMDRYWYDNKDKIIRLAKEGNEDALVIIEISKKDPKLHEYRLEVEKLGRLVKAGEKTIEIRGEPKKDAIFDCDKTQMDRYWYRNKSMIKQLAKEGNKDALVIIEISKRDPKLHEYRLVVEKLGRLVKRGEKTIKIQGEQKKDAIFDCDKTKMGNYWYKNRKKIEQLAKEGNDDAIVIMEISKRDSKLQKLHEYRIVVENLGRLLKCEEKLIKIEGKHEKAAIFDCDKTQMDYYWIRNKTYIEKLAKEGNKDAIVIMEISERDQKLHEYRLVVEKLGRLVKQGEKTIKIEGEPEKPLIFDYDKTQMDQYWRSNREKIEQLAKEGNKDAIVIMEISEKDQKLHEYRLVVEKLGRLVKQGEKTIKIEGETEKPLIFDYDKTQMDQYWRNNREKIEKLAKEGNEDALVIIEISKRDPKLHEYRLVVEKLGRLVKRREKAIKIEGEPEKPAIFDCDKTQMDSYWYANKDKIMQLAREENEDAIIIMEIASRDKSKKVTNVHQNEELIENKSKNKGK